MPIFNWMARSKIYTNVIKPFFDVIVAFFLLMLLIPIFILTAIAVRINTGRSPIFRQLRVGKDERIFELFKFRTMKVDGDEQTTTRLGRFLRSASIDELPQLFNVARGDMSLVGPRPLLPEYLPFYNDDEKTRHNVSPGITGWAQTNGRNEIDWGKRMELDVFYANRISFVLDLKILIRTLFLLMVRDKTPYKKSPTIKFSEYASKR